MIDRYVFHNKNIVPIEQVRLSPGQAGLLSGWGLFTTLRIVEGEPFAFERHWRRLEKDAARTRVPFPFDSAQVRAQLRELLLRNEVREGTARIYMIYNTVGFWRSNEALPEVDLLLYTAGLPPNRESGAPNRRRVRALCRIAAGRRESYLVAAERLEPARRAGAGI